MSISYNQAEWIGCILFSMDDCVFCQIAAGKLDSAKIFEDDIVLAFMDMRPLNPGAAEIIPKQHFDHFIQIPDDIASHLLIKAQAIARKIQLVFKPERVGYVVHGYGVNHAHLKLIPLNHPDDIGSLKYAKIENGKVVFDEIGMIKTVDLKERQAQAEKLNLTK